MDESNGNQDAEFQNRHNPFRLSTYSSKFRAYVLQSVHIFSYLARHSIPLFWGISTCVWLSLQVHTVAKRMQLHWTSGGYVCRHYH